MDEGEAECRRWLATRHCGGRKEVVSLLLWNMRNGFADGDHKAQLNVALNLGKASCKCNEFPPFPLCHFPFLPLSGLPRAAPTADLLPAWDDNLALCLELISVGRRSPVSLRRSCSQWALLQLPRFNHRTFANRNRQFANPFGCLLVWIYACIVLRGACILRALGIQANLSLPCQHSRFHCGRQPGEYSITIPTSVRARAVVPPVLYILAPCLLANLQSGVALII